MIIVIIMIIVIKIIKNNQIRIVSQECFSRQLLSCSTSSTGWFSGLHISFILIRMMMAMMNNALMIMMFVRMIMMMIMVVSLVFRIEWNVYRYKISLNIKIIVSAVANNISNILF